MAGNVSTPEGAKFLFELGVDVVKVGQGPGHACTTRLTGVGVPQLTAVAECSVIARRYKKTVIADGGIKSPGDIAKALIAGADAVMIGYLFAGTEESAARSYALPVKELGTDIMVKDYIGEASFQAQLNRVENNQLRRIRRPEGIKRIVPVIGPLKKRVDDLLDGLRSAMSYVGAKNIKELKEKGRFVVQSQAGLREGIEKFSL
jgi:IMP dehydrogenase